VAQELLAAIEAFQLSDCWEWKALLDGKKVMEVGWLLGWLLLGCLLGWLLLGCLLGCCCWAAAAGLLAGLLLPLLGWLLGWRGGDARFWSWFRLQLHRPCSCHAQPPLRRCWAGPSPGRSSARPWRRPWSGS
jgi:hypothetical protein